MHCCNPAAWDECRSLGRHPRVAGLTLTYIHTYIRTYIHTYMHTLPACLRCWLVVGIRFFGGRQIGASMGVEARFRAHLGRESSPATRDPDSVVNWLLLQQLPSFFLTRGHTSCPACPDASLV